MKTNNKNIVLDIITVAAIIVAIVLAYNLEFWKPKNYIVNN